MMRVIKAVPSTVLGQNRATDPELKTLNSCETSKTNIEIK